MKAGKEHQVALSKAAMKVLHTVRALTEKIGGGVGASNLVFPNDRSGKRLSENSLTSILKRMKFSGITVHGFRSAFRDWAGEELHFPNDVIEMALAHRVGDKTEQAYRERPGSRNAGCSPKHGPVTAESLRWRMRRCWRSPGRSVFFRLGLSTFPRLALG